MKSRAGGFALISVLITIAIIAMLKLAGGKDGKNADQVVIQAGDRAVANMIPSCSDAPQSCDNPRFANLTAYALRKAGYQPGACMVCREEGGVRFAAYHSMAGEYQWRQGEDGVITAERAPAAEGGPGAPGMPAIPAPAGGGGGE